LLLPLLLLLLLYRRLRWWELEEEEEEEPLKEGELKSLELARTRRRNKKQNNDWKVANAVNKVEFAVNVKVITETTMPASDTVTVMTPPVVDVVTVAVAGNGIGVPAEVNTPINTVMAPVTVDESPGIARIAVNKDDKVDGLVAVIVDAVELATIWLTKSVKFPVAKSFAKVLANVLFLIRRTNDLILRNAKASWSNGGKCSFNHFLYFLIFNSSARLAAASATTFLLNLRTFCCFAFNNFLTLHASTGGQGGGQG